MQVEKEKITNIRKKCGEIEKGVLNRRKPDLNLTIQQVTVNLYNKFLFHDTHCLCYSVNLILALYHISSTKKYREKERKNICIYIYKYTKLVIYPMIQLVIVILYTKYELSILYSCGDICDEKCREKDKWINIGKNKQENAGS